MTKWSHGAINRRQWEGERGRRRQAFNSFGRQQTQRSAVDAVAPLTSLFQLLFEVEAHQVLARDDADHPVGHVDDGQVTQAESAKNDVCSVQWELFANVWRRLVDEGLLQNNSNKSRRWNVAVTAFVLVFSFVVSPQDL